MHRMYQVLYSKIEKFYLELCRDSGTPLKSRVVGQVTTKREPVC